MTEEHNLTHHGIKGMKWGIRRKRNSQTGRVESKDSKLAKSLKRKKLSEMSNDELRQLTQRMQLERSYKQLSKGSNPGKSFVQDVLRDSGKNIATQYVTKAGTSAIQAAAKIVKRTSNVPAPQTGGFRSTTSYKFKRG